MALGDNLGFDMPDFATGLFADPNAGFNSPKITATSPTVDPTFGKLYKQTQRAIPTEVQGLESLIQGGMNSPLLELVLGPMLQRLQAPQAAQRQQLTEATRAAGGLRGSTYGQDMNTLLQNQGQAQNDLMGQVVSQVLGQLIQGQLQSQRNQFLPGESLTNLLKTISPTITSTPPVQPRGPAASGGGGGQPSEMASLLAAQKEWDQMTAAGWRNLGPRPGSSSPVASVPGSIGSASRTTTGGTGGGGAYTPYEDPFIGAGGGWADLGMGGGQQWMNTNGSFTNPNENYEESFF